MADRASLMTEFVTNVVREFNLDLARIHNDSTTLKAYLITYESKLPIPLGTAIL